MEARPPPGRGGLQIREQVGSLSAPQFKYTMKPFGAPEKFEAPRFPFYVEVQLDEDDPLSGASQHGPRCLIRESVDAEAVLKKIIHDETSAGAQKQKSILTKLEEKGIALVPKTSWEPVEKRPDVVEGFHPMPDLMSMG
eukprot:gene35961-28858_t